jgi:hypothetical protein
MAYTHQLIYLSDQNKVDDFGETYIIRGGDRN